MMLSMAISVNSMLNHIHKIVLANFSAKMHFKTNIRFMLCLSKFLNIQSLT